MSNRHAFCLLLLGLALGVGGGIVVPQTMLKLAWIGDIFINMLKLICLPLIFSALVTAIVSMGNFRQLGKIGGYTLIYVLSSVSFAVCIGLVLINVFHPGIGLDPKIISSFQNTTSTAPTFNLITFIQGLFPDNIIAAASKFQVMPVVIYSVVFSLACIACGKVATPIKDFFIALRHVLIKMITWLMHLTPIGLFSLVGTAVARSSQDKLFLVSLKTLGLFILIFLTGLLLQILWQGILHALTTRMPIKHVMKATAPALMTAFATSSSMATLPVALNSAQQLGLPDKVARFILPLATTINLSGTAMYEAVAAVFFCQILGIDLTLGNQIGIFFIAILAGMGATGIPEGGLVTMVAVLNAVNVPTSAIALLLPFDRILDRCRTMVNVWGDLMCTRIVNFFLTKNLIVADDYYEVEKDLIKAKE